MSSYEDWRFTSVGTRECTALHSEKEEAEMNSESELEHVLQVIRQVCVSAYEDGLAKNTAAGLKLDEQYIRQKLLAWGDAHSAEARKDELSKLDHAIEDRPRYDTFAASPNGGDIQRYIAARNKQIDGEQIGYDPRMYLGWPAQPEKL